MSKPKVSPFPILEHLLAAAEHNVRSVNGYRRPGDVWTERGEYLTMASDYTIVSLGTEGYEKLVEAYLEANPGPENW